MESTRWLDEREARAWRGFERMRLQLSAHLHRSLLSETGLSLADYVVLVVLSESNQDRIRAKELSSELQWEKSRLSHHLTRMERRGLVQREECQTDARGQFVVLTDLGRKAIEEAAPFHVADVRNHFVDLLTPAQLEAMAEISDRVLSGLAGEEKG